MIRWLLNRLLLSAAKAGDAARVERLLSRGADVSARDGSRRTPLHIAAGMNHTEVVSLLLTHGPDLGARDVEESTPLHYATTGGALDAVRLLLQHGADVNVKDGMGMPPVYWTGIAHVGGMSVAMYKRELSAPGFESAADAARKRAAEVATLLLDHGADPNVHCGEAKLTPLHKAAGTHGASDVVAVLLQRGANPNAQSRYRLTPLHFAAQEGVAETARLLLEHGANAEAAGPGGTPIQMAEKQGHGHLAGLLQSHRAKG